MGATDEFTEIRRIRDSEVLSSADIPIYSNLKSQQILIFPSLAVQQDEATAETQAVGNHHQTVPAKGMNTYIDVSINVSCCV